LLRMHTTSWIGALRGVLVMGVLRSVQAVTITSCNGVVHLPAGHHTLAARDNCTGVDIENPGCPSCTIVGEPGAVIDAPASALLFGASQWRTLALNGSLVFRGSGSSQCLDIGQSHTLLQVSGNVSFQDCANMNVSAFDIIGPSSDGEMVSVTNMSMSLQGPGGLTVRNNAHVMFTDTTIDGGYQELSFDSSHVIFERTSTFSEDGYYFTNSTIVASNTSFTGGHNQFSASNSVMNLTNSSVSIADGNMGISVANCSLDVTCASPGPVFDVGFGHTYLSFSDSMVRFKGCSCHLDHAIRNDGGPLSIQGGSMTFSSCQPYGGAAKANPVVVV